MSCVVFWQLLFSLQRYAYYVKRSSDSIWNPHAQIVHTQIVHWRGLIRGCTDWNLRVPNIIWNVYNAHVQDNTSYTNSGDPAHLHKDLLCSSIYYRHVYSIKWYCTRATDAYADLRIRCSRMIYRSGILNIVRASYLNSYNCGIPNWRCLYVTRLPDNVKNILIACLSVPSSVCLSVCIPYLVNRPVLLLIWKVSTVFKIRERPAEEIGFIIRHRSWHFIPFSVFCGK